jgi:hypothetical protein
VSGERRMANHERQMANGKHHHYPPPFAILPAHHPHLFPYHYHLPHCHPQPPPASHQIHHLGAILSSWGGGGGTKVARAIVVTALISLSLLSPPSIFQVIAPVPWRHRWDNFSSSTATTAITTYPCFLAESASSVALQGFAAGRHLLASQA